MRAGAIGFACGLLIAATAWSGEPGKAWWQELPAQVLAEMACGDFELDTPPPWRLRAGNLKLVEDRWGKEAKTPEAPADPTAAKGKPTRAALEAQSRVELAAGGPDWERYAATAEVMLAGPRSAVTLAAAAEEAKAGYQVEVRAQAGDKLKLLTSAASRDGDLLTRLAGGKRVKHWLTLWARPDLNALAAQPWADDPKARDAALRRLQAEFVGAVPWDERWLRLRIEVTERQARLWADGLLVASDDWPKWAKGGICLALSPGDRVRLLRVEKLPPELDGSPLLATGALPLDLTARFNADALHAEVLPPPGKLIAVRGLPFLWTCARGKPNHLDLSKVDFRGSAAYVRTEAASNDPKRVMLRVPRRQYRKLALIAAADTRDGSTNVLNVRMVKPHQGMVLDRCFAIPEVLPLSQGETGGPALPLSTWEREGVRGALWLVRVPLDPGAFQDFLGNEEEHALELDLNGPPHREGYPEAPAKRCGVRIFAATLVESPVEMKVTSGEAGHIFVQPQVPVFKFHLRNTTPAAQSGQIEAKVTDFYGEFTVHKAPYSLAPRESKVEAMQLPVEELGLHYLDARLLDPRGEPLIRRQTTFALLPPDTRQADRDSPFGIWVFMDSHFGAGAEAAGSLIHKLGARWSHVGKELWEKGFSDRHKVYPAYNSLLWQVKGPEEALKKVAANPQHQYWTVFAEQALSGRHYGYFPPELLEHPAPRKLTDDEEKLFQQYWDLATKCSGAVREKHPGLTLSFGNGYPQFIATFLSRKYPRKLMDGLALDFMGDNIQMFYYLKEVAKHYGYGDLPFFITEGFYVCSGCGYYPDRAREREQSDAYIRGFLRGFALGVAWWGTACEIWDPGSEYYYTGYGSVGLCHKGPELNPKPGYCAYATMTRLLDRAKFHSLVPTGSVNAYCLRFDGPKGPVHALWTTRGSRSISLKVPQGSKPRLTDSQSNSHALPVKDGRIAFEIAPSPIWLDEAGIVGDAQLGKPSYESSPAPSAKPLVQFTKPDDWTLAQTLGQPPCPELEELNDETPVKLSSFDLAIADGRTAGEKALAVTLKHEPRVSPYRLRYAVLRPRGAPPVIPAGSLQLGLWLCGNGAAWVDIELTDAKGERWTTVPRRRHYCYGIPYGGPHAFDGWQYVQWPLPGIESAGPPPWARWRSTMGDGKLDFPVRLTGLVLEQFGKVVNINELVAPDSPTWRVGDVLRE